MVVNNEIGTGLSIETIGEIVHNNEVLFHTDVTRVVGHILIGTEQMSAYVMSFSTHRMHGPKGVSMLHTRVIKLEGRMGPVMYGGHRARITRSRVLNVLVIVRFGKAVEIVSEKIYSESVRMKVQTTVTLWIFDEARMYVWLNDDENGGVVVRPHLYFLRMASRIIVHSVSKKLQCLQTLYVAQRGVSSRVVPTFGHGEERDLHSVRIRVRRFNKPDEVKFIAKKVIESVRNITKETEGM
ncbi:MAG: aminotransferase class V-fold PLP-dependent enzyme [Thaumarchaeota archaeon]|nr:aminotransferase class V-fold PLP-dependent enzyme [Nitrososphaerota archaeon]MDE0266964.1 aminotransferase class V-fold PLP-dependent enzyme [Nitrososphaerota archaeon]MDE0526406.1 aminotransferase class V-fold PLP-dependent enzyme [Nitrososphaerota archaeon]